MTKNVLVQARSLCYNANAFVNAFCSREDAYSCVKTGFGDAKTFSFCVTTFFVFMRIVSCA